MAGTTYHKRVHVGDTEAFKLRSWVNAYHQRLIVRLLFVDELDIEQPKFVSLWPALATLEEIAGFGREGYRASEPPRVYPPLVFSRDFPSPGQARVI
jgi:hypothetical protein